MASELNEASPFDIPFRVHPSVQDFLLSPTAYISRHFTREIPHHHHPTFLATGAIVFDRASPPRVLLVQRAPSDSMPLLWETPGGGCDDGDTSILHACVRELKEEAGLDATSIGPFVRCPAAKGSDSESGTEWAEKFGCHCFFSRKGKLIYKFSFMVEVRQPVEVVLDPAEHVAYLWATEEEVRNNEMKSEDGKEVIDLKFTIEEQRKVVLEAFEQWNKRTQE